MMKVLSLMMWETLPLLTHNIERIGDKSKIGRKQDYMNLSKWMLFSQITTLTALQEI